jgi:hypothetical protein
MEAEVFAADLDALTEYAYYLNFTEDGGSTPGIYVYDETSFHCALLEATAARIENDETMVVASFSRWRRSLPLLSRNRFSSANSEPFNGRRRILESKYDLGKN